MTQNSNSDLIQRGWVALQSIDTFDPVFDLLTQWNTRESALADGRYELESMGSLKPSEPFWIAEVYHGPIRGEGACRTSVIKLQHVEKVDK